MASARGSRRALVLARKRDAALHATGSAGERRPRLGARPPPRRRRDADRAEELKRIAQTLAAHEPERVLERGYAIVSDAGGDVVTSAEAARRQARLRVRFSDDDVLTEVIGDE
ncbi:MAG: exodeoxyribonuclease VII large subunit [Solirubrobacterales bacterium]